MAVLSKMNLGSRCTAGKQVTTRLLYLCGDEGKLTLAKILTKTIVAYKTLRDIKSSRIKLDGVGPVDNRPSPTKLHHFVQKKKKRKKVPCDT